MNDTYAKKVWTDCTGDTHETKPNALAASRRHEIGARMNTAYATRGSPDERKDSKTALRWFLNDPERIIAAYKAICEEVDEHMRQARD